MKASRKEAQKGLDTFAKSNKVMRTPVKEKKKDNDKFDMILAMLEKLTDEEENELKEEQCKCANKVKK